jgi:nitrite reductase/ring-hydroxylating ferredoxin subunit
MTASRQLATRLQGLLPTRDPRRPPVPAGRLWKGICDDYRRTRIARKDGRAELHSGGWAYVLNDVGLQEGQMTPVYPLGINILLARMGGTVYGVSGKCAHMACPLSAGRLEGLTIICSCHDWRFDVRTGRFLDAQELGLTVYATKLETGKLYVNLG